MAHRYEFLEAAAKDLFKLTQHNPRLLHTIATLHIPAILRDPQGAGEPKKGDLSHIRGYGFIVKGVAYRLIYEIQGDVVLFIALGTHDAAYDRAKHRR